ncbi:Mitochondrial 37S ribosomal protein S27 [Leucoagaricus sp. SymC.cos]|nr:Mitochondrial 37S ribosomal protein S27 [Leucoagaricus sp. SymC.cos]
MNLLKQSLFALTRARAEIFQTAFNPNSVRTGAKYLRRRLRGPSMLAYYPPTINLAKVVRRYPQLEMVNDDEQMRLEDIEFLKKRGKGTPKKQGKGESRRAGKRR